MSAPVSVVPPPMGPSLGGGVGRVTAGAVVTPDRGTVVTSSGGGGAASGTPLRSRLNKPLREDRTGDKLYGRLSLHYHSRGPGGALHVRSGGKGIGGGQVLGVVAAPRWALRDGGPLGVRPHAAALPEAPAP